MNVVRSFGLLALCACLAGCITVGLGGGGEGTGMTTYTLSPAALPKVKVDGAPVNWQLVVNRPIAVHALATNRIVVVPEANVIKVFEGAQWSDRAPELVQTLLIQGLEASGRITAVDRPESGLRGDYTLVSELRAFQAEYDGETPRVRVALSLRLLQPARNRVLAADVVEVIEPVAGGDIVSVVQAFDAAAARAIAQSVRWTLDSGEANRVSGPPEPWR